MKTSLNKGLLRRAGAQEINGPTDYGGYHATFFEDPDGNRLEVCFLTRHGGLSGTVTTRLNIDNL